jgi:hypothetical protein
MPDNAHDCTTHSDLYTMDLYAWSLTPTPREERSPCP